MREQRKTDSRCSGFSLGISFALILLMTLTSKASPLHSQEYKGVVEISSKQPIFIHWQRSEHANAPIIVLVNGLTYETTSWDAFVPHLLKLGYSVLRYDPQGMGETLAIRGTPTAPIDISDQARELRELLQKLEVNHPVHLVGLSYGGGLLIKFTELFPEWTDQTILVAPFTEPLESQDQKIKTRIRMLKTLYPGFYRDDEKLYSSLLKLDVYTSYPLTEPSILKTSNKREAVFQMTEGIRKTDMFAAARQIKDKKISILIAGMDQYIPRSALLKFWQAIPKNSQNQLMVVRGSEHKVPEDKPEELARIIDALLSKKALDSRNLKMFDQLLNSTALTPCESLLL